MAGQSAVILGDACCGKTNLVRVLNGQAFDAEYIPTVSAVHTEMPGGVALWDVPGMDRLMSATGGCRVNGFTTCVLVCDMSSRRSFDGLGAWLDEFLQYAYAGGTYVPTVVVVGTKSDRANLAVTVAELEAFAVSIHVEYRFKQIRCGFHAVVSSKLNEMGSLVGGLANAFEAARNSSASIPPTWPHWTAGTVPENADANPTVLLRSTLHVEHSTVDPGEGSRFIQTPDATVEVSQSGSSDESRCAVGADCAVLVMRMRFASLAATHITSWSEDVVNSSMLRRPRDALLLAVVGVPMASCDDDTKDVARRAAAECGAVYIEMEAASTAFWHDVVRATFAKRRQVLMHRSCEASTCVPEDTTPPAAPRGDAVSSTPVASSAPELPSTPALTNALPSGTDVLNASDPNNAATLALNRRILEAHVDAERRETVYKALLADERAARAADVSRLEAENVGLKEEVNDLKLELRVMWDEIEQIKRAISQRAPA